MKNLEKLFKKQIDLTASNHINGGDYCNSGGTETTQTSGGSDENKKTFNDDCDLAMEVTLYRR